jgi:hypothetical protein
MTRPLIITTVGVIALAPLAGLLWWSSCPPPVADVWRSPAAVPAPVSEDPFDRTIAALTCGASPQEAADAIEFLDTTTRLGVALAAGRRSELISALERGTPSGMTTGTWAHLFNCACNALATGGATPDPKFIDLLERLAVKDSRHEIRLYALQHLGCRYNACDADTQGRIRSLVSTILTERPVSPVAGTALVLARRWESANRTAQGSPVLETARLVAVDTHLPVDVRVTALHTAGEDSSVLGTARNLAADSTQPAILRKSALYLIGRHGTGSDLPLVRRCSRESPRLAQAGDPAAKTLQARLDGGSLPVLHPY